VSDRENELKDAQDLARRMALSCIEELEALMALEEGELDTVEIDGVDFTDADALRQHIEEGVLSVSVGFDGWYSPGETPEPDRYRILLGFGGPSAGVDGELDVHGQPHTAFAWGQGWWMSPVECRDLSPEQDEKLVEWARLFYYGD
jgi:hypothetical protein